MKAAAPAVVVLPDGMDCLRCEKAKARPDRIWCTECAAIVDALPAEPTDAEIDACVARHPAGKQCKTEADR